MRLLHLLPVAAMLVAPMPSGAAVLIGQDFATNPFCAPSNLPGFLAGGCDWFGAQHGQTGTNGAGTATGAFTMAWRGGAGADGRPGFVGYSPATRAGVSLITRIPGGPVPFGVLDTLDIRMNNASAVPAGTVRAAIHTGGEGGQWYLSATGFSANGAWTSLSFDLPLTTFLAATNDANLPDRILPGAPSALAPDLAVDWIGLFVDSSGRNSPGTGDVLRFDDFVLSAVVVPEPSAFLLLGAGLLGLVAVGGRRLARPQARRTFQG